MANVDHLRTQTLALSRELSDIRLVRSWLIDELRARPLEPEIVDDVALMASELLANAIRHTTSAPTLTLVVGVDDVVVAVHDDDPRLPEVLPIDVERPSGNGMRIVDAWSDRWGVDVDEEDGKTVWFTVACG